MVGGWLLMCKLVEIRKRVGVRLLHRCCGCLPDEELAVVRAIEKAIERWKRMMWTKKDPMTRKE